MRAHHPDNRDRETTQSPFEREFEREILLSERLRLTAIVILASVVLSGFLIWWVFFNSLYHQVFGSRLPIHGIIVFFCGAIASALVIRKRIDRSLHTNKNPPKLVRYVSVFAEVSLPTIAMVLLAPNFRSLDLLETGLPNVYFYFIVLSALRLSFRLCVFTGATAAVEYLLFALYVIHAASSSLSGSFLEIAFTHILKSLILFTVGILTGLVTLQIKQRAINSWQSVEERNQAIAQIRMTFGRYVTDEVVNTLLESPEGLRLGGERRTISILTSDLRGFTALAERLPPDEAIEVINLYLSYMADVITQYRGTIDEFMGDGILVLFGAPIARANDAQRAVACAIAMQLVMAPVNDRLQQLGLPPLEMGIGIHTGEVVVGNIGSEKRAKYGIVGKNVNLAYRIESYTVGGQIFISASTLEKADPALLRIDGQMEVQPKGVKQPVLIYEVGGIGGEYNLFLPKEDDQFFPLSAQIPVQYVLLDGKHIGNTLFKGKLTKLSEKGAEVLSDGAAIPAPLTNIKLNLMMDSGIEAREDIYAKVLNRTAADGRFYIRFTMRSSDTVARLETLYKQAIGE